MVLTIFINSLSLTHCYTAIFDWMMMKLGFQEVASWFKIMKFMQLTIVVYEQMVNQKLRVP